MLFFLRKYLLFPIQPRMRIKDLIGGHTGTLKSTFGGLICEVLTKKTGLFSGNNNFPLCPLCILRDLCG